MWAPNARDWVRSATRRLGEARKVAQKLDNADFARRAPDEVVEENRERLAAMQADIARLEAALQRIE